jgi:hypothetical protein
MNDEWRSVVVSAVGGMMNDEWRSVVVSAVGPEAFNYGE